MDIKIDKVFEAFEKKSALVIGDSMLDAYLWGEVNRISPEAPVPVVLIREREYRLGGAANVALNIQKLGAKPYLLSLTGNDSEAGIFKNIMENNNIETDNLVISNERHTTVKTRILGNNHHMLRVDNEDQSYISKTECNQILDKISNLISKMDVLIFQDYDKGMLTKDLIKKTIELANKNNVKVVVDPKKNNFLNYKDVNLFKPNLKELKEGLKIDLGRNPGFAELKESVQVLKSRINAEICMITLSENGIFVSDKTENFIIPAIKRDIYDVSGAGDTVISVAALSLVSGLTSYQIAALSNIAGGMVCEKPGVIPVDKNRLFKEAIDFFESDLQKKITD